MFKLFSKIFSTSNRVIPVDLLNCEQTEVTAIGEEIKDRVGRLFKGSLSIRQIDAGSDNACEQELVALSNAFYDVERFGIHFVASPRHADMLMVTGPVTRNMEEALKIAYEATPDPKIVVAVGDGAIDGGVYKGSYAVVGGAHNVIPVQYQIPGDPPTPKVILCHLLKILQTLDGRPKKLK